MLHKCLSVRQPWASMILSGEKTIEVRTWSTKYRGPLVICASKSPKISDAPTGCAVCIVDLIDVRPITHSDAASACCGVDPSREFAWILSSPRLIPSLPPVSGRLGIFEMAICTD